MTLRYSSLNYWQTIRIAVLERDKYTCQLFGEFPNVCSKNLSVHHKISNQDDSPANLITLCGRCHRIVENIKPSDHIIHVLDGLGRDENWYFDKLRQIGIHTELKPRRFY